VKTLSKPLSHPYANNYSYFNPEISINSGQMFLWEKHGSSWYGIYGEYVLKITDSRSTTLVKKNENQIAHDNGEIKFFSFPPYPYWERQVFRLDDDIDEIFSSFSNDVLVSESIGKYPGLRLMRQEPHQCMVSFACASNTNILMIRRMLKNLCTRFGNKITIDNMKFFTFPSAERLNRVSNEELRLCGLGYRTKAVKAVAEAIVNDSLNIHSLLRLPYDDAKNELLKIHGIGNKVADCILLFSLDKLEAFPIDIWMARVLYLDYRWLFNNSNSNEKLIRNRKLSYEKITAHEYRILSIKARDYFGKYSGYAQQYLFYNARQRAGKKW
jgi:N-glycosylase/DNA lyase